MTYPYWNIGVLHLNFTRWQASVFFAQNGKGLLCIVNQRDKNKRFIGVWVQLDVKQALQSIAKKMNIPLSQLVANALKDLIKRG